MHTLKASVSTVVSEDVADVDELTIYNGYDFVQSDGGYEIDFGFLGAGETQSVVLTFLANEEGTKNCCHGIIRQQYPGTGQSVRNQYNR